MAEHLSREDIIEALAEMADDYERTGLGAPHPPTIRAAIALLADQSSGERYEDLLAARRVGCCADRPRPCPECLVYADGVEAGIAAGAPVPSDDREARNG